jgi:hypothetical protein
VNLSEILEVPNLEITKQFQNKLKDKQLNQNMLMNKKMQNKRNYGEINIQGMDCDTDSFFYFFNLQGSHFNSVFLIQIRVFVIFNEHE